jgi:hypothetical protein
MSSRPSCSWWSSLALLPLLYLTLLAACAPAGAPSSASRPPDPSATATAQADATVAALIAQAHAPVVNPDYLYDQLFSLATTYQHREAGYDNNLPVATNGHDEFAAAWSHEMTALLQGFGPTVRRDPFSIPGWSSRPTVVPAFNVEVTVPGITHPEQVIVIGCHYDGEAISTQSAYDDTSGCAIELGVARALGEYWRAQHVYPARTLRFVLFDAEERGLFGSFHYVNETVNGDLPNVVAMINEEQNGIAYPLRFLGKTSNPLLPFVMDASENTQTAAITRFDALLPQAAPATFAIFRALGITTLDYRDASGQRISQPVFAADQVRNVQRQDGALAGSDEFAFIGANVPQLTLGGNTSYASSGPMPPWSFPFDRAEDTVQLMNVFASGGTQKARALVLALAIPAEMTAWLLHQPEVAGEAPSDGASIAALSDVGQTVAGKPLELDASAAYLPGQSDAKLTYAWDFGDGATGSGATVTHTYAAPGSYTLTLTVRASSGSPRMLRKPLVVATLPTQVQNPFSQVQLDGHPSLNPAVPLPTPDH